jgi:hypothetical protein
LLDRPFALIEGHPQSGGGKKQLRKSGAPAKLWIKENEYRDAKTVKEPSEVAEAE